ncbi:MAG TPA: ABC transporter ATP-binding protein [Vineibacter sp.]|nr:ABC transporter ATP-binding protein [Vineibacter sp.]
MQPILEARGICKSFGALRAVQDLTFSVNAGEILGMIGPNGAGKTTAVNLISGTARPDAGEVRLAGERVTGMAAHRLVRRGLVRTFQSTTVYGERTVWQNIYRGTFTQSYTGFWSSVMGGAAYRHQRERTVERVERLLADLRLDDVRDTQARHLPYGRQKALGIAVALASAPKLVLLDEPAAGLSAEEADRVAEIIKKVRETEVSVVVIDHNMRFIAQLCHRVVVLHHGAELCIGTPREVTSNPLVIEAYLGADHEPA